MDQYLLVVEDNQSDFVKLLEFIGGKSLLYFFQNSYVVDTIPVSNADEHSVNKYLCEMIDSHETIFIKWAKTGSEAINFIGENKNVLLSFVDMQLKNENSLTIFEKLMNQEIPVLISSSRIDEYWDKLHQIANGKYFELLSKDMILRSLTSSGSELASVCKSVAGLIYLHPKYFIQNKLRKIFDCKIYNEGLIINEVTSKFYPYLNIPEVHATLNRQNANVSEPFDQELYNTLVTSIKNSIKRKPTLRSEVGHLDAVIMHEPESEIEKVNPINCEDYLFNQPVNYRKYKEQHIKFRMSLQAALGETGKVFTIRMLLEDLLKNDDISKSYSGFLKARYVLFLMRDIKNIVDFWELICLEAKDLIHVSLTGEIKGKVYFNAIPNIVFTRDWGFITHDKAFLSNMNKNARRRETAIAEFLFRYHPIFDNLFDHTCSLDLMKDDIETVEGGDVLIATPNTILIGFSDRTKFGAVKKFARIAFTKIESLTTVIATIAPLLHPKSMHLDTFMGFLNYDSVMLDKDTFSKKDQQPSYVFRKNKTANAGEQPFNTLPDNEMIYGEKTYYMQTYLGSFIECLKDCLDPKPKENWEPIQIDFPIEQYDDSLNVFAVAPNKVFIYERSYNTIEELKKYGWGTFEFEWIRTENGEILLTDDCQKDINMLMSDKDKKVLFLVDGDELALARGGPHCMTFPISRGE